MPPYKFKIALIFYRFKRFGELPILYIVLRNEDKFISPPFQGNVVNLREVDFAKQNTERFIKKPFIIPP